jgi:pyruvate dehydrogenase E2 component (dihydrolipoamide acetyltransferase)
VATEIKLPSLGEGVDEAEVLDVLVQEGDEIEGEQSIIEVETDKASAAVPCAESGRVEKIHVAVGDTIHTGDVLLTLADVESERKDDTSSDNDDDSDDEKQPQSSKSESSDEEQADDSERDTAAGTDHPGNAATVKDEATSEEAEESEDTSSKTNHGQAKADHSAPPPPASPAVRRFAREADVNIGDVTGTGPGGRITRDDIKAEVAEHHATEPPGHLQVDDSSGLGEPESDAFGEVRVERLSKLQQTMARRMHESWATIPRVTNFDDVDVTQLEQLRQASKDDYAEEGIKLSVLPLIAKAVALTLKKHPLLNAVLDTKKDEVHFKQYVNLGIAIDTPRGLVVPSLRQADLLSMAGIARRIEELADAARQNKLTRDDFYGSTFTISNLGSIGGTYSTPIINPPEVAILLLGRSRRKRVFIDDELEEPRMMMPLSLSYDHRLIDGATAARFLNDLKAFMEAPTRLLMSP